MASDTTLICNKPECTLAQTGRCVLDHDPASCPIRLESLKSLDASESGSIGEPVLASPTEIERFQSSYSLNISQAQTLMQERYCNIIGILGAPDAGKTACLVSFYLLLAHGRLSGFDFRDSKTAMAFEEICRGARRWDVANYPEQLTLHTEITDERTAGFLHLRLKAETGKIVDFLLPDLPGEWSTSLIDSNRTDRLNF